MTKVFISTQFSLCTKLHMKSQMSRKIRLYSTVEVTLTLHLDLAVLLNSLRRLPRQLGSPGYSWTVFVQ